MTPEKRLPEDEATGQEPKRLKEDTAAAEKDPSPDSDPEKDPDSDPEKETEEDDAEDDTSVTSETAEDEDKSIPISDKSGTLLFAGTSQWALIGRRSTKAIVAQTHYSPRRLKFFADIKVSYVISHCSAAHTIIITNMGKVYTMGRNEKGQLGVGDCEPHAGPKEVEALQDVVIVNGAVGRNHSLFLSKDGEVYACGENKAAQCGLGNTNATILVPTKIDFKDGIVKQVSCGAEFSMIVDQRGNLYSFGCPEYGQLGHNTDGKFFVTSNKISYEFVLTPRRIPMFVECAKGGRPTPVSDVTIVEVACGNNHAVARDSKKRVYAWGFGGYGRLGHAEPKDEMIPRLIKFFDGHNRGVLKIYCGAQYTIAETELGVFLWGQTKRTGEANMYPKPIQDLYGWNVRSVGCSATSIVIAADDTVIAWGPSPTYGELALGDNTKSTTVPKECKQLSGIHVYNVACSMGCTLMVARTSEPGDKALIDKLKEITI